MVISPEYRVLTNGGSQRRTPPTDPGDPQIREQVCGCSAVQTSLARQTGNSASQWLVSD
jgi:hypothetical protein